MSEINYDIIKDFLIKTLDEVYLNINPSLILEIRNFINHDEYEIAYEILFTEIIKLNSKNLIDYDISVKIGLFLELNYETIYNPNFWNEFIDWLEISR